MPAGRRGSTHSIDKRGGNTFLRRENDLSLLREKMRRGVFDLERMIASDTAIDAGGLLGKAGRGYTTFLSSLGYSIKAINL